ncbi:hypothetical protein C8A00DRAFT_31681 [Chaetomidium leptoderma]|uniref:Uncharacterized protein n=1 Tax=Chaetomidium leptoderma TaxID=669021 RepID=A0AAN6VPL2_9PEZI|nr:hypothetical protein C8A00DRAFT_31681 [Chaetomidium leptoderma]
MVLGPEDPGYAEENRGPLTLTVTTTLTSVCLLFVLGRVYSRLIWIHELAIDDWMVVGSIVLAIESYSCL